MWLLTVLKNVFCSILLYSTGDDSSWHLTHCPLGDEGSNFKSVISKHILQIIFMNTSCETAVTNAMECHWWWVNIGSVNGLMPSGNKRLPDPMLTQISCVYDIDCAMSYLWNFSVLWMNTSTNLCSLIAILLPLFGISTFQIRCLQTREIVSVFMGFIVLSMRTRH